MTINKKKLKTEIAEIADRTTGADFSSMLTIEVDRVQRDADRAESLATEILRKRVYDDVRALAKEALTAVLDGEADAESVTDRIFELVDSACIYTKDCYMYAWLLDEADDADEYSYDSSNPTDTISKLAFANLRAEVSELVSRVLDNCTFDADDDADEES